jgi:hypothetical protein
MIPAAVEPDASGAFVSVVNVLPIAVAAFYAPDGELVNEDEVKRRLGMTDAPPKAVALVDAPAPVPATPRLLVDNTREVMLASVWHHRGTNQYDAHASEFDSQLSSQSSCSSERGSSLGLNRNGLIVMGPSGKSSVDQLQLLHVFSRCYGAAARKLHPSSLVNRWSPQCKSRTT